MKPIQDTILKSNGFIVRTGLLEREVRGQGAGFGCVVELEHWGSPGKI